MNTFRPFLLLTLVAVLSLSFVERSEAKVYASNVRVTQDASTAPFDGSFADRSGAAIRFFLNQTADSVVINIVPAAGGAAVKTLRKSNVPQGDNSMIWNGSNNATPPAPAPIGAYKVQVSAYHAGFASYTEISYITSAASFIFTRGVTSVTNPALRQFGFIYSVSGGGYATGVTRHTSWGRNWGNVPGFPDSALMITTGVPLNNTLDRRYSPVIDRDGYAYVLGRTDTGSTAARRKIYRFHIDTLDAALFDSSVYGTQIQGNQVRGTGSGKYLIVTGDSTVYRVNIGTQSFNTSVPIPLARVLPGKRMVFFDAQAGPDSSLYVIWRADSSWGPYVGKNRGIMKFNLGTGSLPKTVADTVWTSGIPDGDPVTLALNDNGTTAATDDILYMNTDLGAPNTFISGIYAYTNLTATSPTRAVAWADPDNNCSSNRSALALDALGNVIYFENSNEQVVLVSPPSGANSYTYTSFDQFSVTTTGIAPILYSIGDARIDLDGNRIPDRLNDTVKVIGIVNSVNIQTTNFGYFFQDATGGMEIFKSGLTGAPTLRPGYRVQVIGQIQYFSGTTEIVPASYTDISLLDTGNVLTPASMTIGQYLANAERYESVLIQFPVAQPYGFTSANWPAVGVAANLKIMDGRDTCTLRLDSDTQIPGSPYPNFPVRLTGVGSQFTVTVTDTGYQITPMFVSDFVPINAPPITNFRLLTPANGSSIVIDSTASYNFTWRRSVDFNNDPIAYFWQPIGRTGSLSNNNGADSVKTVTGATLLGYLGTAEQLAFRWTVLAQSTGNPAVSSRDTVVVTLYRSFTPPAAGWTAQISGSTATLRSVKTLSTQVGWISGTLGTVLRTTSGGTTWQSVGGGNIGTPTIHALTAVDANIAIIGTTPSTTAYIFRTTNGGTSWDTVYQQAGGFIDQVHMFDATSGIAFGDPVGGKWTIVRTNNGGSSWARIATEPAQVGTEAGWVNSFYALNTSYMWFGTNNSRIYRTTDGGTTWSFGITTVLNSYAVWFNDTQNGVAGFSDGTAARSTDGGVTWAAVTLPGTGTVYGATGAGRDFWIPRGNAVYRSTNLGVTWASEYTSTIGATLRHIHFIRLGNTTAGWVTSSTGGIALFYGTLTGVNDRTSEIPAAFDLAQNFPNPFNPTTTIRYSLPMDAFVSLKVYSILGQEVATLKEEFQNVGTYNLLWNGKNNAGVQAASGVYLYRMVAKPTNGGQPLTFLKKMLLLK